MIENTTLPLNHFPQEKERKKLILRKGPDNFIED